jgi:crotonobetainyl-CoA:carnitine CoA-transferase CaiB-like acyl-CoA transferase
MPTDHQPLSGVQVVELAIVIAAPAASTMLGDWGAAVVKVEPLDGDPHRSHTQPSYFELDNRGKRSIAIDVKTAQGKQIMLQLLEKADVFVTNLRPSALRRLELDYDSLAAKFPRLVYASVTGYGRGDEDRPGYDIGAYWARSGLANALTAPDQAPSVSRPGLGDHPTGLATAAGIAAALYARERTGQGTLVQTSLLRTGLYAISSDLIGQLAGTQPTAGLQRALYNPLLGCYRSGDGHWFWVLGLQSDRMWPKLLRAIERPELASDPRFENHAGIIANRDELIALLDEVFASRTMQQLEADFEREDVWWDPVQDFAGAVADPVAIGSGAFPESECAWGRTVATPVDFGGRHPQPAGRAPEAGEHTEQVLLELGYDWDAIGALKKAGAVL